MALPPHPGSDWTDDERAEIRPLQQLCHGSEDWTLECSHSWRPLVHHLRPAAGGHHPAHCAH
jgi:hypothetical protein